MIDNGQIKVRLFPPEMALFDSNNPIAARFDRERARTLFHHAVIIQLLKNDMTTGLKMPFAVGKQPTQIGLSDKMRNCISKAEDKIKMTSQLYCSDILK